MKGEKRNMSDEVISLVFKDGINDIDATLFKNDFSYFEKCVEIKEEDKEVYKTLFQNEKLPNVVEKVDLSKTNIEYLDAIFHEYGKLREVILPSSLIMLANDCFKNCLMLVSINLPEKLKEISEHCFFGCRSLNNITFPDSVMSIENYAFGRCVSLKSINLNHVRIIGSYAFFGCLLLKDVVITEHVLSIRTNSFDSCFSLETIDIPSTVKEIGKNAFSDCRSLKTPVEERILENHSKELVIPSDTKVIKPYEYFAYVDIEELVIPEGVEEIGDCAFYKCEKLKTVSFPSTLKVIGDSAFQECYCLKTLNMKEGLEVIEHQAFCETDLRNVTFPNSVREIKKRCFLDCRRLVSVKFPDGMKKLWKHLFVACDKLRYVNIPESLEANDNGEYNNFLDNNLYYFVKYMPYFNENIKFINEWPKEFDKEDTTLKVVVNKNTKINLSMFCSDPSDDESYETYINLLFDNFDKLYPSQLSEDEIYSLIHLVIDEGAFKDADTTTEWGKAWKEAIDKFNEEEE